MNEIIRNLTIENFTNLKASFDTSKRIFWDDNKNQLVHPGEYGIYREELIKRWLRSYVPKKFDISSGFIINSENKISSQCDIVIYDKDNTPQIESLERQRFFPIETVAIVGEVKSDINSMAELNNILEKLSNIKKFREDVRNPKPYQKYLPNDYDLSISAFDNVFTFLICNKFNFDIKAKPLTYSYNYRYKHNLILSLQDGLINYRTPEGVSNVDIPFSGDKIFSETFVRNEGEEFPPYVGMFLHAINSAVKFTTLLEIDMSFYYTNELYDGN